MSVPSTASPGPRLRFLAWVLAYVFLAAVCLWSLAADDDLSLGRQPWINLQKTMTEFAHPSFLKAWNGNSRWEYRSDDGTVLRVENQRTMERQFLVGLADASWVTVKIASSQSG